MYTTALVAAAPDHYQSAYPQHQCIAISTLGDGRDGKEKIKLNHITPINILES
jgi:hypothetical protein